MIIKRKTSIRSIENRHEVENKGKESTMYLYGDIGGYYGIDNLEFVKELNENKADVIHIRIDSGGGDIFAARSMKTAMMQHKAKIIGHVDGLAASAASFFLMGCDEIEIVEGGFLMIHNALSFMDVLGYFNMKALKDLKDDIGKEIKLHEKINDSIASDYAKKADGDKDGFLKAMDKETWYTAKEALEAGLVDRIYDGEPVEGSYDLSVFSEVPESLIARNKKTSKRTLEKALRDAGLSKKEAKKVIAGGYSENSQDDELEAPDETIGNLGQILRDAGLSDEKIKKIIANDEDRRDADVPDANAETVRLDAETDQSKKKDRVSDLLCRAEIAAPSI